MTPNNNTTLPDMFRRFADLTQFWYRHTASTELAQREFQEYSRLLTDIPCQIERLVAFADLGTDAMFDAYAKAKAAPPRDDAGQGWRNLTQGETVQAGDECWHSCDRWEPCDFTIGTKCDERQARLFLYRRRIAKNGADTPLGGIRADYQPNEALGGKESQETTSKEAWRMLELGETIQEGDEYGSAGQWRRACLTETKVMRSDVGHYRRRVTPPTPATEQPQP